MLREIPWIPLAVIIQVTTIRMLPSERYILTDGVTVDVRNWWTTGDLVLKGPTRSYIYFNILGLCQFTGFNECMRHDTIYIHPTCHIPNIAEIKWNRFELSPEHHIAQNELTGRGLWIWSYCSHICFGETGKIQSSELWLEFLDLSPVKWFAIWQTFGLRKRSYGTWL